MSRSAAVSDARPRRVQTESLEPRESLAVPESDVARAFSSASSVALCLDRPHISPAFDLARDATARLVSRVVTAHRRMRILVGVGCSRSTSRRALFSRYSVQVPRARDALEQYDRVVLVAVEREKSRFSISCQGGGCRDVNARRVRPPRRQTPPLEFKSCSRPSRSKMPPGQAWLSDRPAGEADHAEAGNQALREDRADRAIELQPA